MTRSIARLFRATFLRGLAILAIFVGQWIFLIRPAGSQTLRPAVRIAYVHQGNIWILDEPSGGRMRLTSDGHDFAPRWIANGESLLFCRGTGGGCATWRWQPGKGIHRVQDGLWSPDGRAVAVTRVAHRPASPTTVWFHQKGQMVRITPLQPGFRWYATGWSPDSRRLALGRTGIPPPTKPGQEIPPTSGSLWVTVGTMPIVRLRRLPLPPSFGGRPGWPDVALWSPDGRFITVGVGPDIPCDSCREDGLPYYAIRLTGGKAVSLGTALAPTDAISWARDGSYVVLSGPLGRFPYMNKHLVRVDPITGSRRSLSHDPRWADIEPAVSPDGRHIAFVRGRALGPSTHLTPAQLIASRHLFLMNAGGTHVHQLTGAPGWTDEAPVWSPDGQWLLFVRWRRHRRSQSAAVTLWAVRGDGTVAQRLARLDQPTGPDLFDVAPSPSQHAAQ